MYELLLAEIRCRVEFFDAVIFIMVSSVIPLAWDAQTHVDVRWGVLGTVYSTACNAITNVNYQNRAQKIISPHNGTRTSLTHLTIQTSVQIH